MTIETDYFKHVRSDFFYELYCLFSIFFKTFNYNSKIVVSFVLYSQNVHSLKNSPRVPIECYHYLILSPKGEFLLNNSLRGSIGLSDLCTICYWYRFFKLRTTHPSYLQDEEDEKAFFFVSQKRSFILLNFGTLINSRKINVHNFLVLQRHF